MSPPLDPQISVDSLLRTFPRDEIYLFFGAAITQDSWWGEGLRQG